jgi:HJR/Mrr/RecB family endonuclease
MNQEEKDHLLAAIDEIENHTVASPGQAEKLAGDVLEAVLREDGYRFQYVGGPHDAGVDFVATRDADTERSAHSLGVQFKYRRVPSNVAAVRELLGTALLASYDRSILLASAGFTKGARQLLERELPVTVELLDLPTLRNWVQRLVSAEPEAIDDVRSAVRILSRTLALLIARDPKKLDEIEWRDLERLLAEAFDGLGFGVVLTPPAKDGGKDIVLTCRVTGKKRTYVVEVKHWVAGGKVGGGAVSDFLHVIASEERQGGVLLSSSGFTRTAFEELSEVDRQVLRFGEAAKIVSVCRRYMKATSGIWSPPENLPEILYEETV